MTTQRKQPDRRKRSDEDDAPRVAVDAACFVTEDARDDDEPMSDEDIDGELSAFWALLGGS